MNIRLANKEDINSINKLFKEVINDMEMKKVNMWNNIYPFSKFEDDISSNSMYVMEDENEIVGSFVLNDFENPKFIYIKWKVNNEKWISINRLAVSPIKQGKGYAKEAMRFIEIYAKEKSFKAIRLTVYEKNESAIRLYERSGFKKVEEGSYIINDKNFIGYEKIIK